MVGRLIDMMMESSLPKAKQHFRDIHFIGTSLRTLFYKQVVTNSMSHPNTLLDSTSESQPWNSYSSCVWTRDLQSSSQMIYLCAILLQFNIAAWYLFASRWQPQPLATSNNALTQCDGDLKLPYIGGWGGGWSPLKGNPIYVRWTPLWGVIEGSNCVGWGTRYKMGWFDSCEIWCASRRRLDPSFLWM